MRRIAIIGQNHPQSVDPTRALWPEPVGSTGWFVWQLVNARTGATQTDYLRAFHRYNLGSDRKWILENAKLRWDAVVDDLHENFDTVVLLGTAVRQATGCIFPQIFVSHALICIPYPSTMNRWYAVEHNRQLVEIIFEELYVEAIEGSPPLLDCQSACEG